MSKGEWLSSEIKQTADEKAKVKEKMKEVVNTNHQQKELKAKVEAEKQQVDKDKADFEAEKKAEREALEDEKSSLESQKKEIEQSKEQNKIEAQRLAQVNKEVSENLSESQEILEEAKGLKAYWDKMIAWAKKCTITVMGETKRFGDWLSKKANQKKAEEKQEKLDVKHTEIADKVSNQKKDINAILASHGLSDDASTEDTHEYGL